MDYPRNNALHYAECHYAECRVLLMVMLSVIMLNVVILSVVAPSYRLKLDTKLILKNQNFKTPFYPPVKF